MNPEFAFVHTPNWLRRTTAATILTSLLLSACGNTQPAKGTEVITATTSSTNPELQPTTSTEATTNTEVSSEITVPCSWRNEPGCPEDGAHYDATCPTTVPEAMQREADGSCQPLYP